MTNNPKQCCPKCRGVHLLSGSILDTCECHQPKKDGENVINLIPTPEPLKVGKIEYYKTHQELKDSPQSEGWEEEFGDNFDYIFDKLTYGKSGKAKIIDFIRQTIASTRERTIAEVRRGELKLCEDVMSAMMAAKPVVLGDPIATRMAVMEAVEKVFEKYLSLLNDKGHE